MALSSSPAHETPTSARNRGFARTSRIRPLVLLLVATALAGCSSAKPELPQSPQARALMRNQGAALIDSLVAAHGGMEAWSKVTEMTFRGTDEWQGPLAKVLNPWPVERAAGQNSYRVHEGLGRISIATDRGTLTYGIGRTGPWALLRGEPSPDPKDERAASYLVAWHGFLAGVPWRFKESGAVAHYLGQAHRRYKNASQLFDEVLVTYPPEGDLWPDDWFVVRMDPITHEMKSLTYTTSNRASKTFETTCEFDNVVDIEGLKIPTRRTCYVSSPFDRELHVWDLAEVHFNELSPDASFERKGMALPAAATPTTPSAPAAPADTAKPAPTAAATPAAKAPGALAAPAAKPAPTAAPATKPAAKGGH